MNPSVEAALAELRANPGLSVSEAARRTGAPRTTVRDNWHSEGTASAEPLERDPLTVDPADDDFEIPTIVREYDASDHFVYPMGDSHKGSRQHDATRWNEWLDYIESRDDASLLGTGDFLNAAITNSVSDTHEEGMTVREAKLAAAEEFKPLAEAGRLDLLIPGNHENRITKAVGDCPIADIAWKLDVPYAHSCAFLIYRIGDVEYEGFVWHGGGSGRSGAQATRMERQTQIIAADFYVSGHTHRQQVVRGATFVRDGERVVRRRQLLISSGSFLAYEPYAAKVGLPPADMGAPRIRLDGRRKDIHVSL